MTIQALDLFAGPGGWDVPDAELGIVSNGIELDPAACATRREAGLQTEQQDVSAMTLLPDHGYQMLKASPPCQTFSAAGKGSGRKALDVVLAELDHLVNASAYASWQRMTSLIRYSKFSDVRTGLVLEPLRYVLAARKLDQPFRHIVLEQVPSVLPVWERYADVLWQLGYDVAWGVVHAEQYGVPQTRKRAVLIASLDHRVSFPDPTHSRYYSHDPKRLDEGVLPWVSMARALQWGMTARPSMTVTGGGTATGGAEPFGNQARAGMRREIEAHRWEMRSNYTKGGDLTGRNTRRGDRPSLTVTSNIGKNGWQPTEGEGRWQMASAGATARYTSGQVPRDTDQPSATLTGKGTAYWTPSELDAEHSAQSSLRVTVQEAAILQTFPADYPWQGTKTQQYQQVGNAIPPLLAKTFLTAVLPPKGDHHAG